MTKESNRFDLLKDIPDAAFAFGADFEVIFWNPAAEHLYKIPQERALGLSLERLVAAIRADIACDEIRESINNTGNWRGQASLELPGDRPVRTDWSISRCDSTEHEARYLAIVRRIDYPGPTELKILANHRLFSDLFHFAPIGLALSTLREGRYVDVNSEVLRIYGASRKEMIGKTALDLGVWMHPESRARIVSLLHSEGVVRNIEIEIRLRTGETIPMLFSATTMEIDGKPYMLSSAQDITERKQSEQDSQKVEEQLWQARKTESLTRMAGAIAHNFNNQLSAVMGNLELVLKDLSPETPHYNYLTKALHATKRSAETSGLMLTYIGRREVEGEPIDLSAACRQRLSQIENPQSRIAFKSELLDPGPVVRATPGQIDQVLTHLLTNAQEAIGKRDGVIWLTTKTVPMDAIPQTYTLPADWQPTADNYACIEVVDSGCGIADHDLDKVFDPFFSTKLTGRGLGLAVSLGIAKQWGGAIRVESQEGTGTEVCLYLPLADEVVLTPSQEPIAVQIAPEAKTVLLVDDDDVVLETAGNLLKFLGYSVIEATDGLMAVDLFREHHDEICCVLTDLSMPVMDGLETIAAIRQMDVSIPIILASGYTDLKVMASERAKRPQAFLHKPYALAELTAALKKVMKKD